MKRMCNVLGESTSLTVSVEAHVGMGVFRNVEVLSGVASMRDVSDEALVGADKGCLLRDPKGERTVTKIGACALCPNNPNN